MITSLQHELANPAIAAFVDAVDVTLDSNTHVMRFDLGGMPDDPGQAICKLVHSDVFADTIIAGDAGFWDNYQSTELLDGVVRQTRRPGTLLVPTPRIMCTSLTPYGFIDRLVMFIVGFGTKSFTAKVLCAVIISLTIVVYSNCPSLSSCFNR